MRRHLGIITVMVGWLALMALPVQGAPVLMQSINDTFAPMADYRWEVPDAGWLFVPDQTYNLERVETNFSRVDGRTVTIEIYDAHPRSGNLLASGTFSAVSATNFIGTTFEQAVTLYAGEDYFIGCRNLLDLGVNVTDAAGAVSLGSMWYDWNGDGSYGSEEVGAYTAKPILRFYGSPYEPEEPEATEEPTPQAAWAGFGDGRINRFDVAPPVVIYPAAYGDAGMGLHLYWLNADGSGSLGLVVTPEQLVPVSEGVFTLVAANPEGTLQVFRLGKQYQVNAFVNGKTYVAIFDELDAQSPIQTYTTG
ncbi:MAG TPA: hypothetical protein VHP83_13805 [Aggregatilineaceae bacterium]|nr:hypothetical protein [Aggregatilineaceae bacterium]